jgi:hypothetical protein
MNRSHLRVLGAFALSLGLLVSGAHAVAQPATNITARADEILRAASEYLAQVPQFTVKAEIWRERVNESGEKLQFSREMELDVKRPDRLHAEIRSPATERAFYYDGKSLTVLDRKHDVFSVTDMPPTLDAALDAAHDQFGIDLPLMDLAISDPYKNAITRVQTGRYFGLSPVLGKACHHLAFTQDDIDWQLWVEDGPQPLIRKLVITHKNEEGSPEFTALLTRWNLTDRIAETDFSYHPPTGTSKIQMRKAESASAAEAHSSETSPGPNR